MQRTYAAEKPLQRALSVCCGSGAYDRRMASLNIAKEIDGVDISPGQLDRARQLAKEAGLVNVNYVQADITKCELEENKYDFILAIGALHHLTNLPHVLKQLHKTLSPNGIMVVSEYIGPDHMDYTPWERGLLQGALSSLPEKYRVRAMDGKIQERAGHVTKDMVIARDPSEGVNASKIYENLREYFDIEIEVEMGHSMLREVLNDIVDNFEDGNAHDEQLLMNLINMDRALRKQGLIKNHHIAGVYRPKSLD